MRIREGQMILGFSGVTKPDQRISDQARVGRVLGVQMVIVLNFPFSTARRMMLRLC